MYGQLVPLGGGDNIPLMKKLLLVGRRESCDVVLRFANVSAHHCQLYVNQGDGTFREAAADAGVTAIIQPGGSKGDEEAIKAANERDIAMVFTGMRHFKH